MCLSMNVLDALVVLLLLVLFLHPRNISATYALCTGAGVSAGLLAGLHAATLLVGNVENDFTKGLMVLALLFTGSVGGLLIGRAVGERLKIKALYSPFAQLDNYAGVPAVLVTTAVFLTLLASILIYIPILAVQFQAQGSTTMMSFRRYAAVPALQQKAGGFTKGQFERIASPVDASTAISDEGAKQAGILQPYVDASSRSVVRIEGLTCGVGGWSGGSGFVAAPGYVVTNAHVVAGLSPIFVRTQTGIYPMTPMAVDHDHDLAVLYSVFLDEPSLRMSTAILKNGDDVALMGYPNFGNLQAIPGKIQPVLNSLSDTTNTKLGTNNTYSTDINTAKGNSGGPLLGPDGSVVGVVNSGVGSKYGGIATGTSPAVSNAIIIQSKLAAALLKKAQKTHFSVHTNGCGRFDWFK